MQQKADSARVIADELMKRGVKLQLASTGHDSTDPMGKMFFNILATFAEFESDLIRMRTREGMAVAKAKGTLKDKQTKLSPMQSRELRRMYDTGDYSISDLSDVFKVSRPTIYRTLAWQQSASGPSIKGKTASHNRSPTCMHGGQLTVS
jgi:DNA invertase Pin-like site-specific DNA recombinase